MRMTQQQRLQVASQAVQEPFSFVSPIKGWNTRDALDAMDPADAIQLDNLYPDAGGVSTRNGYTLYASGLGAGTVKTLAEFNVGATRKFLAAASGAIYDVSASGVVGSPLATGFGSDAWNTVSFLSRLFFANGTDVMQVFDGTTLGNAAFTGGSTPSLATIIAGALYQQRLFFWQANSPGFWFAQLNSISGALSFFDLSAWAPRGGAGSPAGPWRGRSRSVTAGCAGSSAPSPAPRSPATTAIRRSRPMPKPGSAALPFSWESRTPRAPSRRWK